MKTIIYVVPRLSWVLSGGSVFRFLLLIVLFYYFLVFKKLGLLKGTAKFPLVWNNNKISMKLSSTMDVVALKEIYLAREYDWPLGFEIKTIIDLGAHVGDSTLYYHATYPNAKIIAIEPSPKSFKLLEENTKNIDNIIAVNGLIGTEHKKADFYLNATSLGSSTLQRVEGQQPLEVQQYTFKELLDMLGVSKVDLIKFDIEGAEGNLFKSTSEISNAYIGEVHLDLIKISLDDFLKDFSVFDVDLQNTSPNRRYILRAKMSPMAKRN